MALLRLTVAFLTLHLAAADSSSCPATADQQSGQHALLQKGQQATRRSLKVEDVSSDNHTRVATCPWSGTTKVDWQLQCVDGTLCGSWSCCVNHGGRGKCPPNRPLMCASKSCSGGDHCCKTDCSKHGDLRECPAGSVCPYRGTTEVSNEMKCADSTTCTGSGCCVSHGGLVQCPPNKPLMCASKTCSGDHCCEKDCSALGGIRSCMAQVTMIGNSFTHYNNGVDAVLRNFFSAAGKPRDVLPLTKGGADWSYHLSEANTAGTAHSAALGQATPGGFGVVQEQSYIPGTCCYSGSDPDFAASLGNLIALDSKIAAMGATTVLYQTWGWRDGHGSRSYLSTFEKFNAEVRKGYDAYKAALESQGRSPLLAPVGDAFEKVYNQSSVAGSLFYRLFDPDARHPSALGTYLAGCVVYGTITGQTPVGLPAPEIDATDAAILQAAANDALFPA